MSKSATRNSGDLAAKRQAEKLGNKAFRAKPVLASADAESRIRSIKKRFSKSLAHLAK